MADRHNARLDSGRCDMLRGARCQSAVTLRVIAFSYSLTDVLHLPLLLIVIQAALYLRSRLSLRASDARLERLTRLRYRGRGNLQVHVVRRVGLCSITTTVRTAQLSLRSMLLRLAWESVQSLPTTRPPSTHHRLLLSAVCVLAQLDCDRRKPHSLSSAHTVGRSHARHSSNASSAGG